MVRFASIACGVLMLAGAPCAAAPAGPVAGATPPQAAQPAAAPAKQVKATAAKKNADPVPEPGALLLFLGAIAGLAVGRVLHPRRRGGRRS